MYVLYSLIILMIAFSICLLMVPFIKTKTSFSNHFLLSALFVILFSLSLYQFTGDHAALKQWLTQGEKHYQLQQEIKQLGGFAGIITRIKKKLAENPEDAEGWFILGKLYLANHDYNDAIDALGKAVKLRPDDQRIKRVYDLAIQNSDN